MYALYGGFECGGELETRESIGDVKRTQLGELKRPGQTMSNNVTCIDLVHIHHFSSLTSN